MAQPESPIPVQERWGDNSKQDAIGFGRRHMAKKQNTVDLFLNDIEGSDEAISHSGWVVTSKRKIGTVKGGDINPSHAPSDRLLPCMILAC